MARQEFLELAGGAVRRVRRATWLRRSQTVAFFAFSILVTLLLIDRIAYEVGWANGYLATPAVTAWSIGALAVLVAVGCRWAWPLPTAAQALAELDRRAGTDEIFSTAFEVRSDSPFAEALLRQAVAKLRTLDLRGAIPWPVTAYLAYAVPILLTGGILIAFPGATLYPPVADLEASPEEGPAPLRVALRNLSFGHISHLEWDVGDGIPRRAESIEHVFEQAGTYKVSLVARGPRGSDRAEREIRVLPPGTVVAAFRLQPHKGYAPLEVRFENFSRNAASFRWEFGDGTTATERAPTHRFERPGRYRVRLFAEGAERPAEAEVEAYAPDQPLAEFRADPVEGEAPLAVRFENRSLGTIEGYDWDLGDPYAGKRSRSLEENPSFVYTVPGVYTVTLKVRGPNGEDVEEKKHYIRVTRRGGRGAGGGGA